MAEKKSKVAERIEEEHANLREGMVSISKEVKRDVAKDEFTDWKLEFIWALRDFQNELAKHFDTEEDGGFMEDVVRKAPQENRRVELLESEHREFLTELDGITDDLKKMSEENMSGLSAVRERVLGVISRLHEHEASERDLIYTTYFQDIGVGD